MPALPRRRWLRFSLRTLLVLVTALGIWLGIAFHRARLQARAVESIQAQYASVWYDYQYNGEDSKQSGVSRVPPWLLNGLGVDFFHDVTSVSLDVYPVNDDTLATLRSLQNLRHLFFVTSEVTDNGLAHLKALKKLQQLHILAAPNSVGDLGAPPFTDAGLSALAELHDLRELWIYHANIGDKSLEHFEGLTSLDTLLLQNTQVTRERAKRLSKFLPNCNISVWRGDDEIFTAGPGISTGP
jgi:hypothetical protein